ncbi:TetR/AcrR family transcriptional regulator [Streptomyces flavidovirens]|uniref:TetR/AcrR family transcriptional regulator n=1 Tax=Streptomyces flavidovirens TaxID=67298 RepID=UPI001FCB660C|nr:TetR/AcrR family transcriptional regulator [Streptomyces flavidovirens]
MSSSTGTSTVEPRRISMTPGAQRALDAASRLFYEHGIHAVGVDLIAAEAGVTKKTLYDRFGSKEQIVVEYLAARDERWRAFLAERLKTEQGAAERILAVFDASRAWADENSPRGCSMVNAHAEISDPSHPAYAIITGQKKWMLALFTDLARGIDRGRDRQRGRQQGRERGGGSAAQLGRTLMLLHEGALVARGLGIFKDPVAQAREEASRLIGASGAGSAGGAGTAGGANRESATGSTSA